MQLSLPNPIFMMYTTLAPVRQVPVKQEDNWPLEPDENIKMSLCKGPIQIEKGTMRTLCQKTQSKTAKSAPNHKSMPKDKEIHYMAK
jgi:hypothetical protein